VASTTIVSAARSRATPTVLLFLLVVVGLPLGSAAQQPEALVRVLHLVPDAARVDVYADGTRTLPNVAFKTASRYRRVAAGAHSFEVRPSAASSTPAATTRASLRPGAAYTLVLLGTQAELRLQVAEDDFSAPPRGKAKLRIINGAPQSPPLDIASADGPVLFEDVTFGKVSPFVVVPAGSLSLEVRAAGTSRVLFTQGASRLPAGAIITVAGTITSAGKVEMVPVLDAAGAGTLPRGGVATGAGGTARPSNTAMLLVLGLLAVAIGVASRPRSGRG
jgi:hypothetical protein